MKNVINTVIRRMTIEDIDEVCAMEEEAFSMPWHKESFVDMINNRDALYFVAEDRTSKNEEKTASDNHGLNNGANDSKSDRGVICGAAGVLAVLGEGNICNIVVRRDYRDRGIGRRLVESMIKTGKEEYGIKDFTLEVRVSNKAAIGLYESLGFVCEGIRPRFYEKPTEDACIYWLRES